MRIVGEFVQTKYPAPKAALCACCGRRIRDCGDGKCFWPAIPDLVAPGRPLICHACYIDAYRAAYDTYVVVKEWRSRPRLPRPAGSREMRKAIEYDNWKEERRNARRTA